MMEDTKIVKKLEAKKGGQSGTYWAITWDDGKIDNVFNKDWLHLLEQSQQDNIPVHLIKEKKGMYWNITSLKPGVSIEAPPKEKTIEEPTTPPGKPKTKEEQIEKAIWIKELGECIRTGAIDKLPSSKSVIRAYYEEMFRVLEIDPKKYSLVEEAKKLGAIEIKKG